MEFIPGLNTLNLPLLDNCRICPRNCCAERNSNKLGYCKGDASWNINSIILHLGEEPVLSGNNGICNIFYSGCNLKCIYCQNYQISCINMPLKISFTDLEEIIDNIRSVLAMSEQILGFVTPSHCIPQMKLIIEALEENHLNPSIVFNTASYDRIETIRDIESDIDIYLPDYKYADPELAGKYSNAPDYPEIALANIKEMYKQKGSQLKINQKGLAEEGIIIRHLVLPGHVENSIKVLKNIAEQISPDIYVSLMSQYYPSHDVSAFPNLQEQLTSDEYNIVVNALDNFGFSNGWVQDLESASNYLPDFNKYRPFE